MLDILQTTCALNLIVLNSEAILLYTIAQFRVYPYDVEPCKKLIYHVDAVGKTLLFPKLEYLAGYAMNVLVQKVQRAQGK